VDDPRVISTQTQLHDLLTVKTPVGGMARYTDDFYHIPGQPTADVPGNPWILTTLWDMEWRIKRAKNLEELHALKPTFDWVLKYATKTGVLAEQLHPYDGTPLSVAPLTWSHATFVDTVLAYVEKEKELMKDAHA
jgi:GH15 family glucan-1,4-alpha-glucosidase